LNTTTAPTIRWLISRDVPDIARWESHALINQFDNMEQAKSVVAMVAEINACAVGWLVYAIEADRLRVLRIAVKPAVRRQGIGTRLLSRLRSRLWERRPEAHIDVPEENLGAQLWLKSCGATCIEVMPSAACEGDLYRFVLGVK
jgi:ribosomal protein S18 acetylase RimI-like enzyme